VRLKSILFLLVCAARAFGADTYDSSTHQLTVPSVAIGNALFSDMVVVVGNIVSGPSGTTANGSEDTYNPGNNQLTVQSVLVGPMTYHNVVVTVAALLSIGGVSNADSYESPNLTIPQVQVGGTVYTQVIVSVGSILSAGGGMPAAAWDTYDAGTRRLTIAAIQIGSKVYTNAIVAVAKVLSGGTTGFSGFAYVASSANSLVEQFDAGIKGPLVPLGTPTVPVKNSSALSITADASGHYVYVANAQAGAIYQYRIGSGGGLLPLKPASISTPLTATYVVANPAGPYLYATAGTSGIYQFNIGSDGTLAPMSTPSVGAAQVEFAISMDPQGKYLFVAGLDKFASTPVILVYPIGSSGAAGTPTEVPNTAQGTAVAINPLETHVYQATNDGLSIYSFFDGLMSPLAGGVATPGNNAPLTAVVDPSGKYLYVTGAAVSQFTIGSDGLLTPMAPAAVTAGTGPTAIAFDRSGKFAYVSSVGGSIFQFALGPSGGLTPLAPSSATGSGAAQALVVVPIPPL